MVLAVIRVNHLILGCSFSGLTLACIFFQILYEIGELLASATGLCFSRERIVWQPTNASDDSKEPWRALYG